MAVSILIIMILHGCGVVVLKATHESTFKKELHQVENLFNYFDSLDPDDLDWVLLEEKHC